MADTGADPQLTRTVVEDKLIREIPMESFVLNYLSGDDLSLVHTRSQLNKRGNKDLTFGLSVRLTGDGVETYQTLEGNEEEMEFYDQTIDLIEYAHAVRIKSPMDAHNSVPSLSQEAYQRLRTWMSEKIDAKSFEKWQASPTNIIYGGDATSTATIEAADLMTPELISKTKAKAKYGFPDANGVRTQPPMVEAKVAGGRHYVLVLSSASCYDLKRNSEFRTNLRDADLRGSDNKIFTGALGIFDNVLILESEFVTQTGVWGSGSNIHGSNNLFLGAQSLLFDWGEKPHIVDDDSDYKRRMGHSIQTLVAHDKAVFNSLDYATVSLKTSSTDLT